MVSSCREDIELGTEMESNAGEKISIRKTGKRREKTFGVMWFLSVGSCPRILKVQRRDTLVRRRHVPRLRWRFRLVASSARTA